MYWWENPIKKFTMINKPILKVSGEGCQGRSEFEWMGKVVGYRTNEHLKCEDIVIEIMKHNHSYRDARDGQEPEFYTYPLVNNDIQNVKGVWILYT